MESYTVPLIIIFICIILSGFFSATETAFSSLNRIKIKNMADRGNKKAALVQNLSHSYDALLSTILIGNNIVNIACASLATVLFVDWLGNDIGPSISTLIVTLVVLIFGEISPKSIAKEAPESFAMLSAPVLRVLMFCLTPINFLFKQWKKLLSAVFKTSDDSAITEEELLTFVDEAEQGGGIAEQQSTLIRNAIDFPELEAYEIMTPRPDIVAIDITQEKDVIAAVFAQSGYSRLPVYKDSIDHIAGVIYLKDFYNKIYNNNEPLQSIVRNVIFCTESQKAGKLMKQLQLEKLHIAVVVDEFGGTVGIVTLEDMLEELVGEIWDEHDEVVIEFEKCGDNEYIVMGSADVEELFEFFGREEEFDVVTVSGWVTDALSRIPNEGEHHIINDLNVTIQKMSGNRIEKLLVSGAKTEKG